VCFALLGATVAASAIFPRPATVVVPDVLLQAHSASLQVTFYDATALPTLYGGAVFASLHGSWNRGSARDPGVITVPLEGGVPMGDYEDFMTGFVVETMRCGPVR
jgi:hypothetical protein